MQKQILTYTQIVEFLTLNQREAKDLYIAKDLTAKQLAQHYNLLYSTNFQKACFRVLGEKNKGLGGARRFSGNVKNKKTKVQPEQRAIAISLSPRALEILKNQKDTYTHYIERAILYYHKAATLPE